MNPMNPMNPIQTVFDSVDLRHLILKHLILITDKELLIKDIHILLFSLVDNKWFLHCPCSLCVSKKLDYFFNI